MEENPSTPSSASEASVTLDRQNKTRLISIIVAVVLLLAGFIVAIYFLYTAKSETTAQIRDIFIILMAFESLIIGAALVILVVQLAVLTNLLQNEIKPILDATNQTVNTVKGTTTFLSDNLVQPVIKLNEYMAGFKKFIDLIRPNKK